MFGLSRTLLLSASNLDSTDDECTRHHHKEKTLRGDYTRQMQELEIPATDDDEKQRQGGASVHCNIEGRQLPDLMPGYIDEPDVDYHLGLLFNYLGTDWHTDKHLARCVYFDPILEEEHARKAEEDGETEALPPVHVSSMPIQVSDTTEEG